jgi:hypothetical protein
MIETFFRRESWRHALDPHDRHESRSFAAPESDESLNAGLSPERRLDAIADILIRGIARLLIAEDSASRGHDADVAQVSGSTAEVALLNGGGDALMVRRGEERAAKGGRTR